MSNTKTQLHLLNFLHQTFKALNTMNWTSDASDSSGSNLHRLPEAYENLTLGMLFGDIGLTQLADMTMDNLTEHLNEHFLQQNLMAGLGADDTNLTTSASAIASSAANSLAGRRDPLTVVLPVTICYAFIFVAGVLGNVITCAVISRNKSMHTATNYYLFNLAISDLILLLSGMPPETYNIWFPDAYPLNQSFCILQGLLSETSTNATVLTITSFTVERYIAICHPFRQHTMSKLSRAIRFIMVIWIFAFCLAIPQAIQFGVVTIYGGRSCTVKNILVEHAFEVSSFVFFVGPMTLICVLYVLIGFKLRKSKLLQGVKRRGVEFGRGITGQTRVIRMLIAVAVAFFLCWAPFHAQRIMAVYGKSTQTSNSLFRSIYTYLTYVSGVLYFLSTCINPLLYSIMSHKFRNAFKSTLARHFGLGKDYKKNHTYSALSKCGNGANNGGSIRLNATMLGTPTNANSQRAANLLQHNSHQLLDDSQKSELFLSNGATPAEAMNCLKAKCPNHNHQYRHRCVSVTSQATLLTTVSKTDDAIHTSHIRADVSIAVNSESDSGTATTKFHRRDEKSALGSIAEKLRRGTRKIMLFTTTGSTSPSSVSPSHFSKDETTVVGVVGRSCRPPKLQKDNSIESAHTNTISNSSLQEVDAEEFDSAELAKYMGVVNKEINSVKCSSCSAAVPVSSKTNEGDDNPP